MKMTGEQLLDTSVEVAWSKLFDPDVLMACIPGCESLEIDEDGRYQATVVMAIGPLKAKFAGHLEITDVVEPHSCTLHFEGAGGAAGMAKGIAHVQLNETEDGVLLNYEADTKITGKLAQVGSRLIDSVAKKLATEFFKRFETSVTAESQ